MNRIKYFKSVKIFDTKIYNCINDLIENNSGNYHLFEDGYVQSEKFLNLNRKVFSDDINFYPQFKYLK